MYESCEICGSDEVVGDTGLCAQCLDTIEMSYEVAEDETEMDLVEMLEEKGIR